ncbi:MAG: nitroreductase [Rhodospirillales bacterium]|nr:nitroreductase [Rhodospirillales bacterium]
MSTSDTVEPERALRQGLLELIASRRSVAPKRLRLPGPSDGEIIQMIAAALTAPDHGALRPWRFIHVTDTARASLAEVFVEAKRRRLPAAGPEVLDREREKALNGPCLLVACARLTPDAAGIPVHEQLVSVGAAVQNLLLAAHALGYGAMLVSGEKARDDLVRAAFDLRADEILIGFIAIGAIGSPRPGRPRASVEEHLSRWTGPSAAKAPEA